MNRTLCQKVGISNRFLPCSNLLSPKRKALQSGYDLYSIPVLHPFQMYHQKSALVLDILFMDHKCLSFYRACSLYYFQIRESCSVHRWNQIPGWMSECILILNPLRDRKLPNPYFPSWICLMKSIHKINHVQFAKS